MCNCSEMVRTFQELEGIGKSVPPSDHHPACEDYKLVEYAHVKNNGSSIITEIAEVEQLIIDWIEAGESKEDFTVTKIMLTVDQFENLPEFDGF